MNRRHLPLVAIVVLGLAVLACGAEETAKQPPQPTDTPAPTPPLATAIPVPTEISLTGLPDLDDLDLELPTEGTIDTVRGTIQVPGAGYMDGRDEEADPLVMVMSINAWDAVPRTKVVCESERG